MPGANSMDHRVSKKTRREGRDHSRSRVNELTEVWRSLLEKENDSLLHRLVEENGQLEHVLQQYQAKMESIILCSKECLEGTQNVRMNNGIRVGRNSLSTGNNNERNGSLQTNEAETTQTVESPFNPQINLPSASLSSSILHQAACAAGKEFPREQEVCPNDLCESIMAWKLRSGQPWDFSFLLSYFQWHELASILRKDATVNLLTSPEFYPLLMDSVLNGTELQQPRRPDVQTPNQGRRITSMIHQRRSIAFCAYELTNLYRPYYASQSVFIAHFWLQCAFLTFLTFPTEHNLGKIPQWLWPTESQSLHDHPASVDFLLWPSIRSNLAEHWRNYSLDNVLVDLAHSAEFNGEYIDSSADALILSPDGSQMEISHSYEEAIFNLDNYNIRQRFFQKYPNLAQSSSSRDHIGGS